MDMKKMAFGGIRAFAIASLVTGSAAMLTSAGCHGNHGDSKMAGEKKCGGDMSKGEKSCGGKMSKGEKSCGGKKGSGEKSCGGKK